jgi:hypothetical protein
VLYLSICFYILPALGSILKTRKRKLAQISSTTSSNTLVVNSAFTDTTKQVLGTFNTKIVNVVNDTSNVNTSSPIFAKNLGSISITFESSREFNVNIFEQAQRAAILNF